MIDTVEIWCPGQSLVPHHPVGEWVITVNRASAAWHEWRYSQYGTDARWWHVSRDVEQLRAMREMIGYGLVAPDCITSSKAYGFECATMFPDSRYLPFEWTDAFCGSLRFKLTKIVALAVAHMMGARKIVMHGDDMAGTADWDGTVLPGYDRTDERWEKERRDTEAAVKLLEQRGTSVEWAK
jgi:hypothetical protein